VGRCRERSVEVIGVEVDAVKRALRNERGDRVAISWAAANVVRQDDRDAGLGARADRDPAEAVVGDIVVQLKTQRVAVEGQREVRIMDLDEAAGKCEIHSRKAMWPAPPALLRSV